VIGLFCSVPHLLGKEIRYAGDDLDALEKQMRKRAPSWSAFDVRMMFERYLERGFVAEDGDLETLTELLGHSPRRYEDFASETFVKWQELSKAAREQTRGNAPILSLRLVFGSS
jgi:hypothetical protein